MARRRQSDAPGGNLDSLLDTMTNVVGILVILLVVTQLGVQDAVDRITSDTQVGPEDIAAAKQDAADAESARIAVEERLQQQLRAAQMQLTALTSGDPSSQLNALTGEIRLTSNQLQKLRQQQVNEAKKHQELIEDAELLAKEYAEKEKQLTEQITAAENQLADIRALLDDTPIPETPPAKIVYLPNPRPAPEGAIPLYFICREGKIFYWDREAMRKLAQQRAELLVRQRGLDKDPQVGIEAEKLIGIFNSTRPYINDDWFTVKLAANGRTPMVVFERKKTAGEDVDDLQTTRSKYRRGIATIDPQKHYLRFQVWPDSFDVYLVARNIAGQQDLPAGWDMTASADELSIPLGGSLRLGPEPPPDPTPKPANPPPPQPTREVPVDTID